MRDKYTMFYLYQVEQMPTEAPPKVTNLIEATVFRQDSTGVPLYPGHPKLITLSMCFFIILN